MSACAARTSGVGAWVALRFDLEKSGRGMEMWGVGMRLKAQGGEKLGDTEHECRRGRERTERGREPVGTRRNETATDHRSQSSLGQEDRELQDLPVEGLKAEEGAKMPVCKGNVPIAKNLEERGDKKAGVSLDNLDDPGNAVTFPGPFEPIEVASRSNFTGSARGDRGLAWTSGLSAQLLALKVTQQGEPGAAAQRVVLLEPGCRISRKTGQTDGDTKRQG
ncbi:hypothetical protein C8R47DRAFT_1201033 [Mycena vitilis]|nr:hypothetical protein C8R47DRAFT_1201033 [Mycena vitilis]